MATEKQTRANRRNAKSSTGPHSVEGKAASSRNALKTGLYANGIVIGSENTFQLQQHRPVTPTERSLVDTLVHFEWLLRRYRWLETELWKATQDQLTSDQLGPGWAGYAFIAQPAIGRIHRLRNSAQRALQMNSNPSASPAPPTSPPAVGDRSTPPEVLRRCSLTAPTVGYMLDPTFGF